LRRKPPHIRAARTAILVGMRDVNAIWSDSPTELHSRGSAVAELATRQHGVVAKRQLVALGVGPGAIKHRLGVGRLHRVHAGVYAVGHHALGPDGHRMAAVLAYGLDALLSHRDGAALWQLRQTARSRIDVSVPRRGVRDRPGIEIHAVGPWHPDDRATRRGIPVTSVARTLLDLAEVVRPSELERAFEAADRLRLLDMRALDELRARSHGRHGLVLIDALLGETRPPPADTRSELESSFLALIREAGLPQPATNVLIEGFLVDAVWPEQRLIVELDGEAFHGTRAAFERDRVRDAALQVAGYRVLRITWRRLNNQPAAVIADVRALLWR
jgi:very-short-patch-repair endonuclease